MIKAFKKLLYSSESKDEEIRQVQISQSLKRNSDALKQNLAKHADYCKQHESHKAQAIQLAVSGSQAESLFHVKTAMRLEKQILFMQAIIGNLQDSVYQLEMACSAAEVAGAVQVGSHALQTAHSQNLVEDIEKAIGALQDQQDCGDDISSVLQQADNSVINAEDLLEQWLSTASQNPASVASSTQPGINLPMAPSHTASVNPPKRLSQPNVQQEIRTLQENLC